MVIESSLGFALREGKRQPAIFVGHGSPMNAIQSNRFTNGWRKFGQSVPAPAAIVSISAHWQTRGGTFVTSNPHPKIIYDMYGFPDELYRIQYPARGLPIIADQLNQLSPSLPIRSTTEWGLDHGTWSVLVHMYPEANIPVVQLSMNADLRPEEHYELGGQLRALRKRGVLIIGSGNIVHNLRLRREISNPFDWAIEFDKRIAQSIEDREFTAAVDYQHMGRLAQLAHPTNEHYLPLLYVLGLATENEGMNWFNEGITKGCLGMRCLKIGS
jgi:4,5-DOPA dioxygenase extradiol